MSVEVRELLTELEQRVDRLEHQDRVHPGCEHVRWTHPQDGPCSVPDCGCLAFT